MKDTLEQQPSCSVGRGFAEEDKKVILATISRRLSLRTEYNTVGHHALSARVCTQQKCHCHTFLPPPAVQKPDTLLHASKKKKSTCLIDSLKVPRPATWSHMIQRKVYVPGLASCLPSCVFLSSHLEVNTVAYLLLLLSTRCRI